MFGLFRAGALPNFVWRGCRLRRAERKRWGHPTPRQGEPCTPFTPFGEDAACGGQKGKGGDTLLPGRENPAPLSLRACTEQPHPSMWVGLLTLSRLSGDRWRG